MYLEKNKKKSAVGKLVLGKNFKSEGSKSNYLDSYWKAF